VTSGKVERWTESETGGLNTSTLAEPELVKWKRFGDREISGFGIDTLLDMDLDQGYTVVVLTNGPWMTGQRVKSRIRELLTPGTKGRAGQCPSCFDICEDAF
jgi:hypothetical protein